MSLQSKLVRKSISKFALAVAMATTGVVAMGAIEAPAFAQKKKKDKQEAAQTNYSEGFVATYQPIATQIEGGADPATLTGQVPAVVAAVETDDDRMAAGNLILSMGQKAQDPALQKQGLEMMLQSGKVPAANIGQYNMFAGQLAYNAKEYPAARNYLETALANGQTSNDLEALIAESYFAENNYQEGLTYLNQAIETRKAAGQTVDQEWIKRGLAVAYNNKLSPQTSNFATMLVENEPTPSNWADVVILQMGAANYANPELLDLLRLAREADALREEGMYLDYVDAADYRRLPGEVMAVIDEGRAAGKLDQSATYLNDIRSQAEGRATEDRGDLSGILSSARSSSDATTIVNGANLALSYGDYPAAEMLYTKAMDMAGVDKSLVQTRLGIAQLEQGKAAEAKANFDAVTTGDRA